VRPRSTLIIGLLCAGLFLTIALLSALFPGKTGSPAITLFVGGFAALGLLMILEYRNGRHTLTENGLQYGRMLGQTGALRWNDVRRLGYSESAKWFRIELAGGRVVRVSAMLSAFRPLPVPLSITFHRALSTRTHTACSRRPPPAICRAFGDSRRLPRRFRHEVS
jgi:hypothetical protein